MTPDATPRPAVLLPFKEGLRRLGLKRGRYYDWASKRSPRYRPELPKHIKIGKSSFFIEELIETYIRCLLQKN